MSAVLFGSCGEMSETNIVITASATAGEDMILVLTGSGSAIIDWGDNSKQVVTLNTMPDDPDELYSKVDWGYTHTYSCEGDREIRICGDVTGLGTIGGGAVTALDVSDMPGLKWLICGNEQLAELDITKCKELEHLACHDNNIGNLDVRYCPALRTLYCPDNNLSTLYVSDRNTALTLLDCSGNKLDENAITSVFVSLPECRSHDARIYYGNNPGSNLLAAEKLTDIRTKNWESYMN